MKFLLLLLVIVGAVLWIGFARRRPAARDEPGVRPPATSHPQAMLSCAHCGVHVPASDALQGDDGHAYCCEAHRRAGPRRGG